MRVLSFAAASIVAGLWVEALPAPPAEWPGFRSPREVAQNDLGAMPLASPAVAGNALFIRTDRKLYRIE